MPQLHYCTGHTEGNPNCYLSVGSEGSIEMEYNGGEFVYDEMAGYGFLSCDAFARTITEGYDG
jgi:hypothetical protein